jgi:hypothetical protein
MVYTSESDFQSESIRLKVDWFLSLIIYYKTPFVKKRLLDPFGHNAENVYGGKKAGGYTDVTPQNGILFLNGDADIPAGGLDLANATLCVFGDGDRA